MPLTSVEYLERRRAALRARLAEDAGAVAETITGTPAAFVRRHPAASLAGGLALGFAGTRAARRAARRTGVFAAGVARSLKRLARLAFLGGAAALRAATRDGERQIS